MAFDRASALSSLDRVRPGLATIEVSARSGAGFDAWLARLDAERRARAADYLRAGP